MALSLSQFVVSDGNRKAYELVKDITKKQEGQIRAFIVGPEGSGKTALVRARWSDRDLLSPKKTTYIACKEVVSIIRNSINGVYPEESGMDKFINDLATCDVLFLDDIDGFWEDKEMGPETGKLLLNARNAAKLDTVITSRKPLGSYVLKGYGDALNGFVQVDIDPYDPGDLVGYVKEQQERFKTDASPALSDDAIDFIANEMGETPERISRIVEFFMTQLGDEVAAGQILDREFVKEATS